MVRPGGSSSVSAPAHLSCDFNGDTTKAAELAIQVPNPQADRDNWQRPTVRGNGNGRSTLLGADEESATTEHHSESDHNRYPVGPVRSVLIPSGDQAVAGQVLRDRGRTPFDDSAVDSTTFVQESCANRAAPRWLWGRSCSIRYRPTPLQQSFFSTM